MAVIKCVLKDDKLVVEKVIEFKPGDRIEFDKPVSFFGNPLDCLEVKVPFGPGQKLAKNWVDPCPGNEPKNSRK
jgi:hypothetical protein